MNAPTEVLCYVSHAEFVSATRALVKGWPRGWVGEITLRLERGQVVLESQWGGTILETASPHQAMARMSATALAKLLTAREKVRGAPDLMPLLFRTTPPGVATGPTVVPARSVEVQAAPQPSSPRVTGVVAPASIRRVRRGAHGLTVDAREADGTVHRLFLPVEQKGTLGDLEVLYALPSGEKPCPFRVELTWPEGGKDSFPALHGPEVMAMFRKAYPA